MVLPSCFQLFGFQFVVKVLYCFSFINEALELIECLRLHADHNKSGPGNHTHKFYFNPEYGETLWNSNYNPLFMVCKVNIKGNDIQNCNLNQNGFHGSLLRAEDFLLVFNDVAKDQVLQHMDD